MSYSGPNATVLVKQLQDVAAVKRLKTSVMTFLIILCGYEFTNRDVNTNLL